MLKKVLVDKGQKKQYYYPDYVVSLRGFPVLVVEAKAPSEQLIDGFNEARLYAHELNALFSHAKDFLEYLAKHKEHFSIDGSFVVSEGDLIESYDLTELLNLVNTYIHDSPGIKEAKKDRKNSMWVKKLHIE